MWEVLLCPEASELYRKLREACGKNFRYVSSKSKKTVSSRALERAT